MPKILKKVFTFIIIIALALLLKKGFNHFFIIYFVSGESMEPTLHNTDLLICSASPKEDELAIGDIVCFSYGSNPIKQSLVKRVVAKAGDSITVKSGILFVNGIESPWQFEKIKEPDLLDKLYIVPDGYIFCMGDNRNHSYDCRNFGAIKVSTIRGKLINRISYSKGE